MFLYNIFICCFMYFGHFYLYVCIERERERAFYLIWNLFVLKLIFLLVAVNISVIYFYSSKHFYLFAFNLLFNFISSVENDFDWL